MGMFWSVLLAVGLPSAIVSGVAGIFFRRIEKKMAEEREEQKKREEARRKYEVFQVKTLTATMALSKANALALKNGRCNGETKAALEYLNEVKHEMRDFIDEQSIDHLF